MRRILMVAVLATAMLIVGAGTASAGEWNKGHHNEVGGNIPAKEKARSECLFNGQDEPDESSNGAGDGEPFFPGGPDGALIGDDPLWASTPAGANNAAGIRVQSGGQLVAAGFGNPGDQGTACNGHLNPINTGG